MKPEIGYLDIVIGSFIEDLIGDVEHNMRFVEITDPYFEQLSIEKFTLEHLLREINEHDDVSPSDIAKEFMRKLEDYVCESQDQDSGYIFSLSRDIVRSLLLLYLNDS